VAERLQQMADAGVAGIILVFRGETAKDQVAKIEDVGKAIAGVVD
jgi:hypothetical protein